MSGDQFIDYFTFAGLDPDRPPGENVQVLNQKIFDMREKQSNQANMQRDIMREAATVFNDPDAYARYRAEWEQRRAGGPQPGPDNGQRASPEAPPRPPQQSVRLGSLLAKVVTTYLENKASQPVPQVAGRWRDNLGGWVQFQQNGTAVRALLTDSFNNPTSEGQGAIKGRTIHFTASSPDGRMGQGKLTVSPDGNTIGGRMVYSRFGMPMGMQDVVLIRA
jgi:hypothetical protein